MDEDTKPAEEKLEGGSVEDCKLASSDKPPSAVSAALARLAASPASTIFLQPVESQVSSQIAAEYRAVISKPISLHEIQQRAAAPGYASHDELEQEEHIAELAALPHSDNEFAERSGTLG